MQKSTILKNLSFLQYQKYPEDTHETRMPVFPQPEATKKAIFANNSDFFLLGKSLIVPKNPRDVLNSQNAFSKPKVYSHQSHQSHRIKQDGNV